MAMQRVGCNSGCSVANQLTTMQMVGCINSGSSVGDQLTAANTRHESGELATPHFGCDGPQIPVNMPSNTCEVFFEGRRVLITLNNCSTLREFEERIRQEFTQIRERVRFHLVLYKNNREYNIKNDTDMQLLAESAVQGATVVVYSGGPFSIWLRDEEHSITKVPAPNTYLMHIAMESLFPDFTKGEFENYLHKLVHYFKLANYCIIMTGNQTLVFTLRLDIGIDQLQPAIDSCTKTFRFVHERNKDVLYMITDVITKLRDGLERFVEPHLAQIGAQATKIETKSEACINHLTTLEQNIREVRLKVQEAILEDDGRRQEIIGYLEETLGAIRKVHSVMSYMKSFWADVKIAIESLCSSSFMTDIRVSVAPPAAESKEEHKQMARHLWRTKKFKLNGIAFIAKHAAIRDICQGCIELMKKLQEELSTFLFDDDLPSPQEARQKYTELQECFWSVAGREQPFTTDGEMDDGTVAELKDALGIPYDNTLRGLTNPVQDTSDADGHLRHCFCSLAIR